MATLNQGILERIAGAHASGGGNFIKHGSYLLSILKYFMSKGHKGQSLICEMLVDEAKQIDETEKPNGVGSQVSFVQVLDGESIRVQMALNNSKAFLLALAGESEAEADKNPGDFVKSIEFLIENARGLQIRADTFKKTTKDGSKILTLPKWTHVVQTPEQVRANRERLDAVVKIAAAAPAA